MEKNNETRCEIYVKIPTTEEVALFSRFALLVDGIVDVVKGRYCVDGKSILGLLSLDLSTGAKVIYPKEATEFAEFLHNYKVG